MADMGRYEGLALQFMGVQPGQRVRRRGGAPGVARTPAETFPTPSGPAPPVAGMPPRDGGAGPGGPSGLPPPTRGRGRRAGQAPQRPVSTFRLAGAGRPTAAAPEAGQGLVPPDLWQSMNRQQRSTWARQQVQRLMATGSRMNASQRRGATAPARPAGR